MRQLCCVCQEEEAVFGDLCGACDASYWEAVHNQDEIIRENMREAFPDASDEEIEDLVDAANFGILTKISA